MKNEPKLRKKDRLTPLHFLKNESKLIKKDGLTPLHFLKNESNLRKKDKLQSWHLILAKIHNFDKSTPLSSIFNVVRQFWKIYGNASLSKLNTEAGERGNLFPGEF